MPTDREQTDDSWAYYSGDVRYDAQVDEELDRRDGLMNQTFASCVYVDDAQILWRGKRWSHLYADSLVHLLEFARRIGLKREWLQHPDGKNGLPHFDVTGVMRERAIAAGAVQVTGGDGTYVRLRRALGRGEYDMHTEEDELVG